MVGQLDSAQGQLAPPKAPAAARHQAPSHARCDVAHACGRSLCGTGWRSGTSNCSPEPPGYVCVDGSAVGWMGRRLGYV